jgi:glycosyltransferase involved in cell wall biosynthesis
MKRIAIVPALNEEGAIGVVIDEIRAFDGSFDIVVIDDGSADRTGRVAAARGAYVLRLPFNLGIGGAVQTGFRFAYENGYELAVRVDGDGQHRPEDARRLVSRLGEYDLVIGARSSGTQANHARRFGNGALNWLASYLTGREIPDLTSGFRGARRAHLHEFLHLLPNGFSTPTTTTLAFIKAGYNVVFEPVEARPRVGASKIKLARDGAKFFMIILKIVTIFSPLRVFLPISAAAEVLGAAYGIWTAATQSKIPNGAVLLILFGAVVFLVGLVSEQISALRFEGRQ